MKIWAVPVKIINVWWSTPFETEINGNENYMQWIWFNYLPLNQSSCFLQVNYNYNYTQDNQLKAHIMLTRIRRMIVASKQSANINQTILNVTKWHVEKDSFLYLMMIIATSPLLGTNHFVYLKFFFYYQSLCRNFANHYWKTKRIIQLKREKKKDIRNVIKNQTAHVGAIWYELYVKINEKIYLLILITD